MTLRFLRFGGLTLSLAAASCGNTIGPDGAGAAAGSNAGSAGTAQGGGGNNTSGGASGTGGTSAGTAGVSGSGAGPGFSTAMVKLTGDPKYFRLVRLTNEQWTNSVQSILRLASRPTFGDEFQGAVSGTTDFTNNELVLDVDSRKWTDYRAAAQKAADQVTADPNLLRNVYPGTDAAGFITTVGLRVYRRPLTPAEVAKYQSLFDQGSMMTGTKSAFAKGASVVLEAMLQSPNFLYRSELGPANAPLSGYEMAAKLSLWLRNTTPDDALLQAAATAGSIDTPEGAAATAQRMVDESTAVNVMRYFHGEFLHFDRIADMTKEGVANYDPAINSELVESSYLFFNRIFTQGLGVEDIFLSTTGFVGPKMAALYGGGAAAGSGFTELDLGSGRTGYFTQLPFLMLHSHNADPDAIHRGVNMGLDALCAALGPAVPDIPPLPALLPGQTNRQRVDEHTRTCGGGCHTPIINPLGFAFENFDGMGQYRTTETNGNQMLTIDSSGTFEFVDGEKSWNNGAELMNVLATDPQTHLCYSKKLASFGLQRDIIEADLPLLIELTSVSVSTGSVKQVIVDLVKNDAFRTRAGGLP